MKTLFFFLLIFSGLFANPYDFSSQQKIAVQNAILAKVNGKTISMIDVKKKMDMIFHQSYPSLIDSNQARIQFYEASWRHVMRDMIDNELIISDALDKEIKLTDGEIREVLEDRFGPSVMQTLDKIGLTYEEAWKMIKDELIVQRMSWWFIQSKAVSSVTPQDIRQAYKSYLKKNPPYSEWKYKVISIRANEPNEQLPKQVHQLLAQSNKTPDDLLLDLKAFEIPGISISVSNEFAAKTEDLSDLHKTSLESLTPGTYGKPSAHSSRGDKKVVYRIFYLIDKSDFPAPSFETISQNLRNELVQKAIAQQSEGYLGKLRKHYGFDADKAIPDDFHPFSLQ
jgi:hypothetical protein